MDVSIIIPVYNVAPYIEDCLNSVMRQTYKGSMECLIIDDCGNDDSMAIAERMIAEYNGPIQFQILHHEHNRGLSAARNTGTLQATGDYLYYIDSDDEITDDCIDILMQKALEDSSIEMVQGNAYIFPIQGEPYFHVRKILMLLAMTNNEVRNCFYRYGQMRVNVWNKLVKREFVLKNNLLCKDGVLYEDQIWMFYLLKRLEKASFVSDITYFYKIRPQSIMTGTDYTISGQYYYVVYIDILHHLTLGYEQEEFSYYAKRVCLSYDRLVHYISEYKDILMAYKNKNIEYGNWRTSIFFTASLFLGQFKYGWAMWTILYLLKHPTRIPNAFYRLISIIVRKISRFLSFQTEDEYQRAVSFGV